MSIQIKQSSTEHKLLFFMTLSSDHITGGTGLTCTVTISKAGGSFASPAGAITELANGWYQVAANATDTNTLGAILLHATAATADPFDGVVAEVVAYDPQDAVHLGLSSLPNVASGSAGAVITSGTGTAQLSVASGVAQADLAKILGDSTLSTMFFWIMSGAALGTVSTAGFSPTVTAFECSDITTATASTYIGRQCVVASGALKGQTLGYVTAYSLVGGRGHFTVSPGSPSSGTLSNGDKVVLV